ncbi:MAG: ABC transporter ATP-binding protein [Myxococcaceae bacterium]|nr:MAG: ABC transporter ATP-binding protein [Myxococcaceae bacterium]
MEPLIALRGVTKSWGGAGSALALAPVDLEIGEGQFVCLCGPSGCGKTTLLNLIAGLESPTSGAVTVRGAAVRGPGPERTVMFQESALFPWLTVQRNVEFPLEMAGVPAAERARRVERYLKMVHLWRSRDAHPHELSGGMRQRAAMARALVGEPSILLMDEPFAALDAQTRDVLHGELERIWLETRKTVVFVTHNVREAARLGDRVVMMGTRPGRITRDLAVKLSRPREANDQDVTTLAAVIERELKIEIEKVIREELDDAWTPAGGGLPGAAGRDLGGGI